MDQVTSTDSIVSTSTGGGGGGADSTNNIDGVSTNTKLPDPNTVIGGADSTNTDELTIKQQEAIDSEISSTIALVGRKESLAVLKEEYTQDPIYLKKIEDLVKSYPTLRKMRPDGNCFFRAFSFGILESLVGHPDELQKFHAKVLESKALLSDAGFNQFTVDDFYDTFLELVDKVGTGITIEELEREFHEPSLADYLVVYLRIVTSAELRKNAEFYQNFIEEKTVEEFCQLEVEPMYKESDHIHIIGLTKSLGVAVRVVYMDRGTGAQHTFPEDDSTPTITMLYRPGHYDIVYPGGGE